jgi:predicted  nucleic acid-binding Zn-ribbon protein
MNGNVMTDFDEEIKTKKVLKKTTRAKLVDDSDSSDKNLPAIWDDMAGGFEQKLEKIEKQIGSLLDKQSSGVSPEFNALMDGYVNKANQSQEYKVKFEHVENLYEDLKIEAKTLKEENRKFKADADAAKEALRMSELDLQRARKESEHSRMQFEEQISNLIEDRERLKTKVKQLTDRNEKSSQEYNDIKAELLEHKYKAKQLEQEKQVELETQKRSMRETNKMIEELKEKLDLRTREVEYKDALLNQLIKQVSAEESSTSFSTKSSMGSSSFTGGPTGYKPETFSQPKPRPRPNLELELDDDSYRPNEGSSWGAFRK